MQAVYKVHWRWNNKIDCSVTALIKVMQMKKVFEVEPAYFQKSQPKIFKLPEDLHW